MALTGAGTFALFLSFLFILFAVTTPDDEAEFPTSASDMTILLQFKNTIKDPAGSLNSWTTNSSPCDKPQWKGIICDQNENVFGLQLENMNLLGPLNLDLLTALPLIRTLSFINNSFAGPMPSLKKFKGLKNVFFSMNNFTGEITDDAFNDMKSLKKVVLSRNWFTGRIPSSLADVDTLLEVWMDHNRFVGEIPSFEQAGLRVVNVSNNELEGKIPDRLSKMDPSMFADNKALCGPPTEIQCSLLKSPSPTTENSSSSPYKKLSTTLIASIAGVLIAIIGTAFAVLKHKKRNNGKQAGTASSFDKARRPELVKAERKAMTANEDRDHGRLVFVREESWERFELNDLLKASAEVLGSGEFGSSYKALLINGPAVVVKRFREMNRVGKEEFQGHMRSIGMLSHPNLLPLVAYYYRKEEKLLVTDFVPYGSLASLLHSNRTPNNPSLDWPTRLKIIKGVTRGLNYLYDELSILNAPHGHLKSSNVLLTSTFDPLLTDYALTPLMNQTRASQSMIAFKSPEYKQYGRLSRKSDVWSLGVLILEILTGRLPGNYSRQARGGSDLANWVNSVVREEWTGEVFDGSMRRTRHGEGEMLDLLQIGLGCCEADVNKRWELRDVIEKIVELKERDEGEYEDGGSSMASEGEGYSSRGGITEDDFSFSTNNP